MFGATNIVKNSKKDKWVYSRYGIRFDVIFGIDNSPSSHSDNRKNNFFILGEGPASEKKIYLQKKV